MTHADYLELSRKVSGIAKRIADYRHARAMDAGRPLFGGEANSLCFLAAHNWQGQSWMTPAQNQAARKVKWIESHIFDGSTIADRIINRAWKQVTP